MDLEDNLKYEAVIGLEVHAQLLTKSKAYSNDLNAYGADPNSNVSPVTLGHPGTLPVMNKKTVEYAIKLGLACGSEITKEQCFARKNYFYPDLPKGYQITQDTTPICTGGKITIQVKDQPEKEIRLTRIHMEEDAGKSIHDVDVYDTLVDLNRAGTPLLEIVSEPDLRSSQEAYEYLSEIRKLVRYLEVCDGNMEEGSLRCDANISIRTKGSALFGTKVEVKNMNSIRNVQRAIEFEIKRQINCLESNETIFQETRGFDAVNGITISMRSKEAANDYRYFPEPDLQPLEISKETIAEIQKELPLLPRELFMLYTNQYGLSKYDANNLIESKEISKYYNALLLHTNQYKLAANWVMGEVKSYLNTNGMEITDFKIPPSLMAELIELIHSGKISHTAAAQHIFPKMLENQSNPMLIAEEMNLIQDSSEEFLQKIIEEIIQSHSEEVTRYREGEKKLIGFFMGQLMKLSKGKADPKTSNALLRKYLED